MTDQYAVIGNPVEHSKSPLIHASFASQSGQDLHYGKILAAPGHFEAEVRSFFAAGGKGLNVTVPFKQEAFALADTRSAEAQLAGAVNTLMQDESGKLYGHNTDGIGLVRDLTRNLGQTLVGCRILVLGAGGAARGILQPLLEQKPSMILVANRTPDKAQELAAIFAALGPVTACALTEIPEEHFDWIINASASSLQAELPPLSAGLIGPHTCCYDLMYGSKPTIFCEWAANNGAALTADGLGMLVEQAAESFLLWRKLRPQTRPVIEALRRQLT